jgi:hypothetical protein
LDCHDAKIIAFGYGKKMTNETGEALECSRSKSAPWLTISK